MPSTAAFFVYKKGENIMETFEALNEYYSNYDEEGRLLSRVGSVEFLTTVRYIEKYLQKGMRILEIGAATGRYSHYLARKGYCVDAVELIPHNIEIFKRNTEPDEDIRIFQGNAMELNMLENEQYDMVLLLGPMYHLYTLQDQRQAMKEALRVLKKGGILMSAYCMADATMIQYAFGRGMLGHVIEKGLLDTETFEVSSDPSELFNIVRLEQIDAVNNGFPVSRLGFVGTDMYTMYHRDMINQMDDDTFALYLKYHFFLCERKDLVGLSNHTLDILLKDPS